jgi:hypothetical protein
MARAAVLDGDSKLVFDWVSAPDLKLNVTFAPQTSPNQVAHSSVPKNC